MHTLSIKKILLSFSLFCLVLNIPVVADQVTILTSEENLCLHLEKAGIKAIIFDMDGTIITSENNWPQVTIDFVEQELKRSLTEEEHIFLAELAGLSNNEVAKRIHQRFAFALTPQEIAEAMLKEGLKRAEDSTEFVQGFELFIASLIASKIPVALGTNADLKALDVFTKKMELDLHFGEHLYSYEHVDGKLKPDPAIFLHAAEKLGVKPEECLVFEDSLPGFKAAQAAGMRCICIENDRNKKHRYLVDASIPHFDEVHEGLKKLSVTTEAHPMLFIKQKVKAIIFDMDGTIITTEQCRTEGMYDLLRSRGITELTIEQKNLLKSFPGLATKVVVPLLKKEFNLKDDVDNLIQELVHYTMSKYTTSIGFITGFENFIQQLKRHNIKVGLATSADMNRITMISQYVGLSSHFGDMIFSREHVEHKMKPDPAIFLYTAEQLGCKPEECIVFEDSLSGFKAARAAGMKVIAIKTEYNEAHRQEHTDHAIEHYGEAVAALKEVLLIS